MSPVVMLFVAFMFVSAIGMSALVAALVAFDLARPGERPGDPISPYVALVGPGIVVLFAAFVLLGVRLGRGHRSRLMEFVRECFDAEPAD